MDTERSTLCLFTLGEFMPGIACCIHLQFTVKYFGDGLRKTAVLTHRFFRNKKNYILTAEFYIPVSLRSLKEWQETRI
jgi:hypothetical protein